MKARAHSPRLRGSEADAARLLHELQVHQIELEAQNEELHRVQAEVDVALRHYTELYDFAPIGYFTWTPDGEIETVNLAGASLLGRDRAALAGRAFAEFVPSADRPAFDRFLEDVFSVTGRRTHEVQLLRADGVQLFVHIEAERLGDQQECRAAVLDVTDRRRAQAEREQLIEQLQAAMAHVKLLSGLLPMCASCKKIRDEQGDWKEVHSYVSSHSEAVFTHGLCPDCVSRLYRELESPESEPTG